MERPRSAAEEQAEVDREIDTSQERMTSGGTTDTPERMDARQRATLLTGEAHVLLHEARRLRAEAEELRSRRQRLR